MQQQFLFSFSFPLLQKLSWDEFERRFLNDLNHPDNTHLVLWCRTENGIKIRFFWEWWFEVDVGDTIIINKLEREPGLGLDMGRDDGDIEQQDLKTFFIKKYLPKAIEVIE